MGQNIDSLEARKIQALREIFQFEEFMSEDQEAVIDAILQGDDHNNFIINMASLAGKSLCYQLPGI